MIEYDSMAVPFALQALHAAPLGAGQHADAGHKECAKLPISVKRKEMEASTGIEPVYTDLQSAASPLRQLAEGSGSSIPWVAALQDAGLTHWMLSAPFFCAKTPANLPGFERR